MHNSNSSIKFWREQKYVRIPKALQIYWCPLLVVKETGGVQVQITLSDLAEVERLGSQNLYVLIPVIR